MSKVTVDWAGGLGREGMAVWNMIGLGRGTCACPTTKLRTDHLLEPATTSQTRQHQDFILSQCQTTPGGAIAMEANSAMPNAHLYIYI